MARKLFCYAVGRDSDWEAICLDLDIAVQGHSFEQVERDLRGAIEMYLEEVAKLPQKEQASFFHRPAPLSVRLRYLGCILASVFSRKHGDDQHHQFTMPAAA